ncbi:MAG: oligoribonuclease [Agrococcus casei]|uniref:oligoribonuclease n=1 Tax=Agrococcus casei TaxID=343512 RepID=UPI003F9DF0B4
MTAIDTTGDVLAWTDIETTGLSPADHALLEVACILTDTQLNKLADPVRFVIRRDKAEAARLRSGAPTFVQEMHDRTGLWNDLPNGAVELDQVDAALLAYIRSVAPGHRQARLAGSSVHFDRSFLELWAPETLNHLHYRMLDVSSVAYAMENIGLYKADPNFVSKHAALSDILDSINVLRRINEKLGHQPE